MDTLAVVHHALVGSHARLSAAVLALQGPQVGHQRLRGRPEAEVVDLRRSIHLVLRVWGEGRELAREG